MPLFQILALTLSCQSPAPKPPDPATLAARSLVEAELAFARAAEEGTTRDAFLSVLDDLGVLFRPGPVHGKTWMTAQKPDASRLAWHPSFVEVSRDGDLGYSTGPYTWRAEAGAAKVYHGHFVSVWGKRNGTWKLLMDAGISHPAPNEEDPVYEPVEPSAKFCSSSRPPLPVTAGALQGLERQFGSTAAVKGLLKACGAWFAPSARFYRDGAMPTQELEEVREALEKVHGTVTRTCLGGAVSRSNDLGYTYGLSEVRPAPKPGSPAPPARSSMFLHIWKPQADGAWKVVLDLESPLPAAVPKD